MTESTSRMVRRRRHGASLKAQLADVIGHRTRSMVARGASVIRIDAIWLACDPLDMRAGTDTALARVMKVFGTARPHHAYLFTNKSSRRIKVLVYDGL
ncbi:IS66 family insertion sequence element accessory protein TnpB [Noviherbaspirillum soli]|uniref:IS66 family insertion sequence element accessory protein TnpB n=1 Tax=Noviherbaspirillum soli TaxID=1064518 RepID=UPI001E4FFF1A|nr:IS66 family insertion sequence element accessory protein TnpB [Noviherbaspirillum soli]